MVPVRLASIGLVSAACEKAIVQSRKSLADVVVVHGTRKSSFLTNENHHLSGSGNGGIHQITLQEHVVLHGQGYYHCGKFRSLALMNRDCISQRDLVEFPEIVRHIAVVKPNCQFSLLGFNFYNLADVTVEHFFIVIVFRLNHFISESELPAEALDRRFVDSMRIEQLLELCIHFLSRPDCLYSLEKVPGYRELDRAAAFSGSVL